MGDVPNRSNLPCELPHFLAKFGLQTATVLPSGKVNINGLGHIDVPRI